MSTSKHKSYRKVLSIQDFNTTYGELKVPCKTVIWCLVDTLTSRTVETRHIGITVYVGSYKFNGIEARQPWKPVSIKLKNPMSSKCLEQYNITKDITDAFNAGYRDYILGSPLRSKNLTGTVRWWSGTHGSIQDNATGMCFEVYACNIKGARTWFEETACMYLKEDETVQFDVSDMGTHLISSNVRGNVYFDQAKWERLDHDNLAFRCDQNGKATTGLFK